ncbi:hypothetical protein DL770_009424 [Monosporascus sp. CRB-9-2]|nr:hypothetical protein DL770_009424 [Monosporascus sp. CRB-9-2]
MFSTTFLQARLVLVAGAGVSLSKPVYHPLSVSQQHFEVLAQRASTEVNPEAVTDVECIDPERNVAELSICGSIARTVMRCEGAPESTVGDSGSARFSLKAASEGATVTISKGRWEQGDMEFVLDSPGSASEA